ncbi:hypothetical protein AB0J14_34935 [Micromonospora arborensis]|uniref:hypothetical protein n=1 Tax=Micromonospora arborensis TaxID=2116518 RepID=UPI0033CA1980
MHELDLAGARVVLAAPDDGAAAALSRSNLVEAVGAAEALGAELVHECLDVLDLRPVETLGAGRRNEVQLYFAFVNRAAGVVIRQVCDPSGDVRRSSAR